MIETLQRNLAAVQDDIAAAATAAGRSAGDVRLVCVTKYAEDAWVQGLYDLGVRDFGENRPQNLAARRQQFADDVRWHMIGRLQSNKARVAVRDAAVVHSVDSRSLLDRCLRIAGEEGTSPRILLQANVSGEASKQGFAPNDLTAEDVASPAVAGLMTMAPVVGNAAEARPYFEHLKDLRDRLASEAGRPLPELSMGMSGDFPAAIAAGATIVRVGSRLYEGLAETSHA